MKVQGWMCFRYGEFLLSSAMGAGQEDTVRYTSCGYHCLNMCILKVRIRDGVIVAVEPDDTVNPGIPREDAYLPKNRLLIPAWCR